MSKFLMVQNRVKVMPTINVMSTIGMSTARNVESNIGQFGSGWIHGLAVLARSYDNNGNRLIENAKLCCGKDVYTWLVKTEDAIDSEGNRLSIEKIYMKKQNGSTYDLNISTDFGAIDWTSLDMGLREMVSNAIDGQDRYNGKPTDVEVTITDNARAKDGYIRMFVPLTWDVEKYYREIQNNFICLRHSYDKNEMVLRKDNPGPARIYRKGVLVGTFGDMSLFDYNIPNIDLKESRIVDSYEAERRAAQAIVNSNNRMHLAKYFEAKKCGERVWETQISPYYFNITNYTYLDNALKERMYKNYSEAAKVAYGKKVICKTENELKIAQSKGKDAVIISNDDIYSGLKASGYQTCDDICTEDERAGRVIINTIPEHFDMFQRIWNKIVELGMHANKNMPNFQNYTRNSLYDGQDAYGLYRHADKTVLIDSSVSGSQLVHTIMHELGHYITEASDFTPAMQEFGYKLAAALFNDCK